jgi:hypothetical protein
MASQQEATAPLGYDASECRGEAGTVGTGMVARKCVWVQLALCVYVTTVPGCRLLSLCSESTERPPAHSSQVSPVGKSSVNSSSVLSKKRGWRGAVLPPRAVFGNPDHGGLS